MLKRLKLYIFTGLLILIPFVATAAVVWKMFSLFDGWIRYFNIRIPGAGVAVVLSILILTGLITRNYIGRRLQSFAEWAMLKIPGVSTVYTTIREVTKTILDRDKNAFEYVVSIRCDGHWKLGFVTGDAPKAIYKALGYNEVNSLKLVYMMNAFSPASGIVMVAHEQDIVKIDMPVELALKLVLTGGMVRSHNVKDD